MKCSHRKREVPLDQTKQVDKPVTEQITLDPHFFTDTVEISRREWDMNLNGEPIGSPKINAFLDHHGETLCLSMNTLIYGKRADFHEVDYPATWWDALKDRWYPKWAKRRWPVRRWYRKWQVIDLYPTIMIDGNKPTRWTDSQAWDRVDTE